MSQKEHGKTEQDAMRLCYVCRMPISVLAIKCRYCGADVGRPRKEQETFTVEDLGGEKIGTYTISGNVTDALESFIQEERAQIKEEERERLEMSRHSLRGRLRRITGVDSGVRDSEGTPGRTRDALDVASIDLSPPSKKHEAKHGDGETRQRITIVVLIIAVLVMAYAAMHFTGVCQGRRDQDDAADANAGLPNRAREILDGGGPLLDAHDEALRALKRNESAENKTTLREVRKKIVQDIKSRMYAKPFDIKKLTSTSRDITLAAERDTNAELIALMKEVNQEIGYFAFILTDLNLENETAVFRLNNPALAEKEQQVKVGDMLQKRFRILTINGSGVVMEDTHPEAGGRQLIAKKMLPAEAY